MDFEQLFPGCTVGATAVTHHVNGEVRLLAWINDSREWEFTDYAKTLALVDDTPAPSTIQSAKRGKRTPA